MFVVLPSIDPLRVKVERGQTHVQIVGQWQLNLSTTVLRAVELPIRDPALSQTLLDVSAEILVVVIVWAVVSV